MQKEVLKKLGALQDLAMQLHNAYVDSHYTDEAYAKVVLVKNIKKQLEEQKRGKLKNRKVPYEKMADYLLGTDAINTSYDTLKQEVIKLSRSF